MTRIAIAGITGWTGKAIAEAANTAPEITLAAGISRACAGTDIAGAPCFASVDEALTKAEFDVLIDYTKPEIIRAHTEAAIAKGKHVVIGTSGLTAEDYAALDHLAKQAGTGIVASGNFAITAALMTRFSLMAAKYLGNFEVLDYAAANKADAPSGTARELAERLGDVRKPEIGHPIDQIIGPKELRGGSINGVQVHSIRLPSYSATVSSQFAVPGSRLSISHDAGTDASIYAEGTLLAAQRVPEIRGLVRGLDNLLDG